MNANQSNPPKPRNPHPEATAPVTDLDLEAQIVRAERAVIARDARIRLRADAIAHRVRHDVKRHAGGGIAVGLATLALGWWLKRRHPAAAPAAPAADAQSSHLARDAGLSLATLLPLIWPLLPPSWRRRVTPATASTVVSFVTPWLARLLRRGPKTA